jgi:hypothetical protein
MHPSVATLGRRGGKNEVGNLQLTQLRGTCFAPLAAAVGSNGASSVAAQGTKTISRRLCIALQGPILGAGLSLYRVHQHIMDQQQHCSAVALRKYKTQRTRMGSSFLVFLAVLYAIHRDKLYF